MPKKRETPRADAGRVKGFSDGVVAIVLTLLIFEVRVPELRQATNTGVWEALGGLAPKLLSFSVSFFLIAIFWVNHHEFFSRIERTDTKLLWLNMLLLFWVTIVPFTTAFLGDHSTVPLVVALYALNLALAGMSFTLLMRHVFFGSDILPKDIRMEARRRELMRSALGTVVYGGTALLALALPGVALIILVALPLTFVVPNLFQPRD